MPHKDREARLAYLRAWKDRKRASPMPEAQPDPTLPHRGAISVSEDGTCVQCHCCGRWLRSLNTHLKAHGLDAASYKALYDLPRTVSLWPPALKATQREAALARDQGAVGREHIPECAGRPTGLANRLGSRVAASQVRKGIYARGGSKTRST